MLSFCPIRQRFIVKTEGGGGGASVEGHNSIARYTVKTTCYTVCHRVTAIAPGPKSGPTPPSDYKEATIKLNRTLSAQCGINLGSVLGSAMATNDTCRYSYQLAIPQNIHDILHEAGMSITCRVQYTWSRELHQMKVCHGQANSTWSDII